MPTNTACTSSVEVCALRVAQLTDAGAPQAGPHGYYTDSPISVKAGPVNDTVAEKIARNGCGSIITRVPPVTTIKGSTFEVVLSRWERFLIHLLTGGSLLTISGQAGAGIRAPLLADGEPPPCCIEFWTKAYDGNSQAITTVSTPNASYHHFVLPNVKCSIAEWTADEGIQEYTITGEGSEGPGIGGNGPWNDWPAGAYFTSAWNEYDDSTIPTAACGLQTVPSGS